MQRHDVAHVLLCRLFHFLGRQCPMKGEGIERVRRLIPPMGGAPSRPKGVRDKQRGREGGWGRGKKSEGVRSKERSLTERISQIRTEQNFYYVVQSLHLSTVKHVAQIIYSIYIRIVACSPLKPVGICPSIVDIVD